MEACVVFVALMLLGYGLRQSGYWGDGKFMIEWVENGRWNFYHVLFLPAAQLVHLTLGRLMGWSGEDSLFFLSQFCGALGGVLLLWTGRTLSWSLPLRSAILGLYATTPAVLFWITCVEVHALQLAAASGVVLWLVRRWQRGEFGGDALVAVGVFALVGGTHMSGFGWAPACLALAVWGEGGLRLPRRLPQALALSAVFAAVWFWADSGLGAKHVDMGATALESSWRPELAYRELVLPFGWLLLLPLVGAVIRRHRPRSVGRPLVLSLLLAGSLLPFAFTVDIEERGAYFLSLVPVLLLWTGASLTGVPRSLALGVLTLFVALQGYLSWQQLQAWALPEAPAWVSEFEEETQGRGVVVTSDGPTAERLFHSSSMKVFLLLPPPDRRFDLALPAMRKMALDRVRQRHEEGLFIALTTEIFDHELEKVRTYGAEVLELLGPGELRAGGRLRVFPPTPR